MARQGFVYILASRRNGTLYIGVTSNLVQRDWQHKEGLIEGFTKIYEVKLLVWYDQCHDIAGAMLREKQIKEWKQAWKIELIEKRNPEWRDLYGDLVA